MADVKLSALTAIAAANISATDILPITDADAGTPTTYKITMAQMRTSVLTASIGSGWGSSDYLGLGSGTVPSTGMIRSGQGSLTGSSAPFINSTATWNNAGTTFTHIFANITNTASNASSLLIDLQVDSSSVWKVARTGIATLVAAASTTPALTVGTGTAHPTALGVTGALVSVVGSAVGARSFVVAGENSLGNTSRFIGAVCGTTVAAPTATPTSTIIATFEGRGYTNAWSSAQAGGMLVRTTELWTATASGTELLFQTTPNTTTTAATVLTLGQDASATFTGVVTSSAGGSHGVGTGLTTANTGCEFSIRSGTNAGANNTDAMLRYYRGSTSLWEVGVQGSIGTGGEVRWYSSVAGAVVMKLASTGYLELNQGANDGEILALQSSDVAHGITAETDSTNAFLAVKKYSSTEGGTILAGFSEGNVGLYFAGNTTTNDTTKTTSAIGGVLINANLKSGTGVTSNGANANLCVIRDYTAARFIFDAEGSAHADVEWTTFDRHNDLMLIEDMESLLAPGRIKRVFGQVVKHDRAFFEREGLLHDVRSIGYGRMRGMLNTTRAQMLTFGAIRQLGSQVNDITAQVTDIRSREEQLRDVVVDILEKNPLVIGRKKALTALAA